MTTAVDTPNQFAEVEGRRLAYRSIGEGKPIVLCTRFRGNMDVWDPAFLDALAAQGFRVITFDYSGLGLSTGERAYSPVALAKDARDLIEALDLEGVAIGGWSLGGLAAQVVLALYSDRLSHCVLLGTSPQCRWHDPHCVQQAATHAQESDMQRQAQLERVSESPRRVWISSCSARLKVKNACNSKALRSCGNSRMPRNVVCKPCIARLHRWGTHDTPDESEQQSQPNQGLTDPHPRRCWRCAPSLCAPKTSRPRLRRRLNSFVK